MCVGMHEGCVYVGGGVVWNAIYVAKLDVLL